MDLHRHPFDEGTITKLEIFEAYTKEWLPVFVMSPYQHICIFDLFAGTGRDQKGVAGSPILSNGGHGAATVLSATSMPMASC